MTIRCIIDFKMEDGERVFTAGNTYLLLGKPYELGSLMHYRTINDNGEEHTLPQYDIDRYFAQYKEAQ